MVEGAPHTAKERSVDQLVCLWGAPAPVYKGGRGEAGRPLWARQGFLLLLGGERKGERGKERGGRPPPPSPIRTRGRGGARPNLAAPLSFHQGKRGESYSRWE